MGKTLIRRLLDEFRQWQAKWDRYERDHSQPKPPSVDEFAGKCEAKFVTLN